MKGLIGKKLGMTQVYAADGQAIPVTVLDVSPSRVLQVKTTGTDGYEAIQVGYGDRKLTRAHRSNRVRAQQAGMDSAPLKVREFRTEDASVFSVGDQIGADFFRPGDRVKVTGTSKGRGFSGVMKRYGFGGGTRKSHGGGPAHRGAGSAGMSADPSRTLPGRRLHGQYGNKKSTVRNLLVVQVDAEEQLLLIRGSVPGPANGLVVVELIGNESREYTPDRHPGGDTNEDVRDAGTDEAVEGSEEGTAEEQVAVAEEAKAAQEPTAETAAEEAPASDSGDDVEKDG